MRLTAKFPITTARLDRSVELEMTTPTITAPFIVLMSKLLDEAKDVNKGVMSRL